LGAASRSFIVDVAVATEYLDHLVVDGEHDINESSKHGRPGRRPGDEPLSRDGAEHGTWAIVAVSHAFDVAERHWHERRSEPTCRNRSDSDDRAIDECGASRGPRGHDDELRRGAGSIDGPFPYTAGIPGRRGDDEHAAQRDRVECDVAERRPVELALGNS
jgi:hypothetical protein